jgi:hypothetical protein
MLLHDTIFNLVVTLVLAMNGSAFDLGRRQFTKKDLDIVAPKYTGNKTTPFAC